MRIFLLASLLCTSLLAITVGRDPSWYPLDFGLLTPAINAYTQESLSSFRMDDPVTLVDQNLNTLFSALDQMDIQAILSGIDPHTEVMLPYLPSSPLLLTGPVLITRTKDKISSLKQLAKKSVGVTANTPSVLIVQKHPTIIIITYEEMTSALQDLVQEKIDGAVCNYLPALSLLPNFPSLQISTPPLTDEGIRFFCSSSTEGTQLKRRLNKQIRQLFASGKASKLFNQYIHT